MTVLDPTADEEESMVGMVVVATLPSLNQVSHVIQTGQLEVEEAIDVCLYFYFDMGLKYFEMTRL